MNSIYKLSLNHKDYNEVPSGYFFYNILIVLKFYELNVKQLFFWPKR